MADSSPQKETRPSSTADISKTKSEIAQAAGISPELLRRWMMEHRNVISAMGVRPTRRLLPPKVVRYICSELGIEDEDFYTKPINLKVN